MNFKLDSEAIDLSNQDLQLLPDLTSCASLAELIASHNSLTSLSRLPRSLVFLDVSHNKLAFTGNLEVLSASLQHLDLSYNRLISVEGLEELKRVEYLNLSNNYIGDDQVSLIKHLSGLRTLNISHNHLRDSDLPDLLKSLEFLEEFINASNDFLALDFDFPMPSLKKLILDSNKLHSLAFKHDLRTLQVLSVCENNLGDIQGLGNLPELKELYLDNNGITEFSCTFERLQKLSLKHNKLQSIQELDCPGLQLLDISYNQFQTLDNDKFPKLIELNVSYNKLEAVPSLACPLESLCISHNKIRTLKGVQMYSSLITLVAGYNKFENLKRTLEELKGMWTLEIVDIRGIPMDLQSRLSFLTECPNIKELNGQEVAFEETSGVQAATASFNITDIQNSPSPIRAFPNMKESIHHTPKNSMVSDLSMFSDFTKGSKISLWDSQPLKNQLPPVEMSAKQEDYESLSVSQLESFRELESTYKSSESLTVTSVNRFQEFFNQKEKELSERINRLENETQHLLHQESHNISISYEMQRIYGDLADIKENIRLPPRHNCCCKKRRRQRKHHKSHHRSATPSVRTVDVQTECKTKDSPQKKTDIGTSPTQSFVGTENFECPPTPFSEISCWKNEDSSELVVYALTPPRPILAHEASTPIVSKISEKSPEFSIIGKMIGHKIKQIQKTYTFSLINRTIGEEKENSQLMFFVGDYADKKKVFFSANGFADMRNRMIFTKNPDSDLALLALVNGDNHKAGEFVTFDSSMAVPIYLVHISNYYS